MKPKHLALALLIVGVLVTGVVLLLLPEDDVATPTAVAPAEDGGPEALPTFRAELGEVRPTEPIVVPAADAEARRTPGTNEERRAGHRRISGSVLREADGSALANAIVAAEHLKPVEELSSAGIAQARTGAEGDFKIWAPTAAFILSVSLEGAWPARVQRFEIEPGEEDVHGMPIRFDSGFSISGLVVDESGNRLRDALVDVNGVVQTHADATGHFTFNDVAPPAGVASVRVSARAPGHANAGEDVLVPRDSSETINVELRLPPGGAIAGRVTDGPGAPLAGVQAIVRFEMTREHGSQLQDGLAAWSNELGDYRIESVPEGRYIVEVGASADLLDAETLERLKSMGYVGRDGSLQSAGTVNVPRPISPSGFAPRWFSEIAVQAGQTTRLDVVLFPPGSLSGRVIDEGGVPVADARVKLERIERWPAPDIEGESMTSTTSNKLTITSRGADDGQGQTELAEVEGEVRTDARGTFEFTGVIDGDKRLNVTAAGLVSQSQELDLQPAETRTGVDFVLVRGLSIRGRVRDPQGAPIEGARVEIRQPGEDTFAGNDWATDAEGRFEITGLPPGPQQLLVFKTGFSSIWKHVEPGSGEMDLTMQPAPKVIGYVVHAVHGEPITNFDVSIAYGGSTWANTGGTYPEGRFELPIDSDTPCTVTVRSAGFHEVVVQGVLPSRTATQPLEIRLRPQ